MTITILSIAEAAEEIGCKGWQLQRAFDSGLVPDVQRIGLGKGSRVISGDRIGEIRDAMIAAGMIKVKAEKEELEPAAA